MNKPKDTMRSIDDINYPNRLYPIPAAFEQKDNNLKNEFSNPERAMEELPASPNLYDKLIQFCSSWRFVFIFITLFSAFVLYSIVLYWFL